MARQKIFLSLQPEDVIHLDKIADSCCNGNRSETMRKMIRGGHAARKISEEMLRQVVKESVENALNKPELWSQIKELLISGKASPLR